MSDAEQSPPPPAAPKGSGAAASEGDWTCADCGNINFAWRNACNRCAKARTPTYQKKKKLGQEIGKQAAEKSRGLFSADDWQCNKCGNVNWARRQQCNVCNAPKFGEVEERTGFGGGYNDRGVVEYKEREDSDDEYDEFGRRKRRQRERERERERDNGTVSASKSEHKHREPERVLPVKVEKEKQRVERHDDEEEEDEEEDDDGDLSKYDLSDWGDAPAKSAETRHRSRRSRSRSRSRSKSRSKSRSRSPISKPSFKS